MSRSWLHNKWMKERYANVERLAKTGHNPHRMDEAPKNSPSRYIKTYCSADVHWLQESTSYGGHSIPKGGHRRISGLVRANLKEEVRKQISEELTQL